MPKKQKRKHWEVGKRISKSNNYEAQKCLTFEK